MHTLLYAVAADPALKSGSDSLGRAVATLYTYSLTIVGLAIFIMFLYAGLLYVVPENFRSKILPSTWEKNPITVITDAVIGFILLLSAYLILNTINPDLVTPQSTLTTTTTSSSGTSTGAAGLPTAPSAPTAPTSPSTPFVPGGGRSGGAGATTGY